MLASPSDQFRADSSEISSFSFLGRMAVFNETKPLCTHFQISTIRPPPVNTQAYCHDYYAIVTEIIQISNGAECCRCCRCCRVLQSVAECCRVLKSAAVCCSLLQCAAVCCSLLQFAAVCCSVLQCVAVCRSVLQCVAVCCSVLQCVAVCCSVL